MQSSKYFTAGVQIGIAGALFFLICALITQDTDWLIMQLFFTCIYLNSYHCRKAEATNFRLKQLEMLAETVQKPMFVPPIPDFDKLPRF